MLVLILALSLIPSISGHQFSTLFTAQDVRDYLSSDQGITNAINWCQQTAVTHVYLETYRDNYTAEQTALLNAKQKFLNANFEVSGCVCTTKIGKPSTGWDEVSCYTNTTTQDEVKSIFQYTASLFDHIIIDDFWFTDCQCDQCNASLRSGSVTVGGNNATFENTTDASCTDQEQCMWKDMRRTLMSTVSRYNVLAAAQQVNPRVRVTIKYPNWYDSYQDKGYDTSVETDMFDAIWVGTESRDYNDTEFGGIPGYFGFFNMRWLINVGGAKCGGGWYDPYGTHEQSYVEQARATILGGAQESFLFHYGDLLTGQGQKNVNALRQVQAELTKVANNVVSRDIVGIGAYKPTNSHSGCVQDPSAGGNTCSGENHIYDFVGMLGLPINPVAEFPSDAACGFFPIQSLKDSSLTSKLNNFIRSGRPTLVTDGLVAHINTTVNLTAPNVYILQVKGDPRTLLSATPSNVPQIRDAMLKPLGWSFNAPTNISLFPFSDGSWVIENYGDNNAVVTVNGKSVDVATRGWVYNWV